MIQKFEILKMRPKWPLVRLRRLIWPTYSIQIILLLISMDVRGYQIMQTIKMINKFDSQS